MPINPHKDETQSEWMSRCVPEMVGTGPDKRPQDQAVAACLDIWRNKDKDKAMQPNITKQPEPDPDESEQDFMDRCLDETDGDQEVCDLAWENRRATAYIAKTHAGTVNGMEFVLSDESVDRMGDVVSSAGWSTENFQKNPIALGFHNPSFVVGTWKNLRVENNELRGHLQLAPEGTSARIDEVRKLIEAGILKAVSVGFRALKHEPLKPNEAEIPPMFRSGGTRFLEQELVEASIVSVPANANSLAVAKDLDISANTMAMVFAGQGAGKPGDVLRRKTGGHADISPTKVKAMNTLASNIQEAQGQLGVLRDALQEHLASLDNDNVSDDQMKKTDDFHSRIAKKQRLLEQFVASEKALGGTTAGNGSGNGSDMHTIRMPTRQLPSTEATARLYPEIKTPYKPGDLTWKAVTCMVRMQSDKYRKASSLEVIRDTYGEDDKVRMMFDQVIGKAATVPALTTTTGWAAELVRTDYQGFLESLQPASVAVRLFPKGLAFSFATNGIISIPMRQATPTIAGSFVGEGAPIPVRQGAFTAVTLIPKKLAVITVFSREISEHSTPAIEGLLRSMIVDDTAVAIDTVLLDNNPATAVRPAGLRNGLASLTPTAGGGFNAVVGDVKLIAGALITSTLGNVRNPVWIAPPNLVLALRLTVIPNGGFAFPEIAQGMFMGYPIIESASVTADTLYMIDAADFMSATGDARFDVSDAATVHMEDTTPLANGSARTPATVAAPTRSFWQTDTMGIRMIMPMNWALRRPGMVQYITTPTWK